MAQATQRWTAGILWAASSFIIACTAFIVWLQSVWMITDDRAFGLAETGWTWIALQRFLLGSLIGLAVGLLLFGINRWIIGQLRISYRRVPVYIATAAVLMITLVAGAGSVQFVMTKPFM